MAEENKFEAKLAQFEDEDRAVANEREELKRVRDKYCTEKVQFDRQAEEVKEQAEQDAQESRKIGYFMTHKENLIAQLG